MNRKEQNTWNTLNNTPLVRPMKDVVAQFQKYMSTYHNQEGYKDYSDECYIADVLYGLGVSLSDDYRFAQGFKKFKKDLIKLIDEGAIEK
jgi:hypothetical protein